MIQRFTTHSAQETKEIGKKISQDIAPGMLVCLKGDLGSGKTTLAQGLLEALGALPPYTSPTFIIMKQYELPLSSATDIRRVYHADSYRVTEKDFVELGFAEWCADRSGVVILEWPERIQNILPEKRITITLRALSENEREITLQTS